MVRKYKNIKVVLRQKKKPSVNKIDLKLNSLKENMKIGVKKLILVYSVKSLLMKEKIF